MTNPSPLTLDELRTAVTTLSRTAGCAQPDCKETVLYRPGLRGRRQRFCSGACRAKFSRERKRLHKLLGRLEDAIRLADPPLPSAEADQLREHLRWLLDGYGGYYERLIHDGLLPLPFASWDDAISHSDAMRAQYEELRELGFLEDSEPASFGSPTPAE